MDCHTGRGTAELRERYQHDYQRLYHAKRRASEGPARPKWRVQVPGGVATVTLVRRHGRIEARCAWGRAMHAVALLESLGATEVEVHGRGGGRGRRRKHMRALVGGRCDVEAAGAALGKTEMATLLRRDHK